MTHEISVDSNGLWDTIKPLQEWKEYRLRQALQRIRNSFEGAETNVLRWIQGTENLTDALTKFNISMLQKLNQICSSGYLNTDITLSNMVNNG